MPKYRVCVEWIEDHHGSLEIEATSADEARHLARTILRQVSPSAAAVEEKCIIASSDIFIGRATPIE